MAVEWTERLSVGFDAIDAQHQELIRRFNELLEACRECRGREKIAELLAYLDEYVDTHFRMEEALMERHDYPDAAEHLEEHRYFNRKLKALKDTLDHQGPSPALVVRTNQTLLAWFLNHIREIDVKFGAFLRVRTASGAGTATADPSR